MGKISITTVCLLFCLSVPVAWGTTNEGGIRIKELCRLAEAKENSLVGYGLVTGLAGTGDSLRSDATLQSIKNLLLKFGVNVSAGDIRSRNVAAVIVSATLPAYAQPGDKIDINVSSLGDARSLVGGTLLRTHLVGADNNIYALAQGPVLVGGFHYDLNGNVIEKNHSTSAYISNGAIVQKAVDTQLMDGDGDVQYVLIEPDFSTASRIVDSINTRFGGHMASAVDAARIKIHVPKSQQLNLVKFLTSIESLVVVPDNKARIVVNERTGTVVSGGNVTISPVTITHGNLKVSINTDYMASQPFLIRDTGADVRTQVVPDTTIEVVESEPISVSLPDNSSVMDLVSALNKVKATSRDIITILQTIKRAGALHAELIIQ